jgi:hypothetical protein
MKGVASTCDVTHNGGDSDMKKRLLDRAVSHATKPFGKLILLGLGALAVSGAPAFAADWKPTHPINLIVP